MATIYKAWEAVVTYREAQVGSMRSDAQGYSHEGRDRKIVEWKTQPWVVRITKSRTDRQSDLIHDVWVRPGYKSPF